MTVVYFEEGSVATDMPYREQFDRLVKRIPAEELELMVNELNRLFDETEIQTSSWIPGGDWTDTIWAPIYFKACGENFEVSAKFFGQLVFLVAMERPEKWNTGRFFDDDVTKKGGRTYFRPTKG